MRSVAPIAALRANEGQWRRAYSGFASRGPNTQPNIVVEKKHAQLLMVRLTLRAGLRHVRGVRPNRAAIFFFWGGAILDRKNSL